MWIAKALVFTTEAFVEWLEEIFAKIRKVHSEEISMGK